MRVRFCLLWAVVAFAVTTSAVSAQSGGAAVQPAASTPAQLLQPQALAPLLAPVNLQRDAALQHANNGTQLQPVLAPRRGQGFGLMIAGGALFVAGLLVGGSAGAVMDLAGAGIGAYGLYLYFR